MFTYGSAAQLVFQNKFARDEWISEWHALRRTNPIAWYTKKGKELYATTPKPLEVRQRNGCAWKAKCAAEEALQGHACEMVWGRLVLMLDSSVQAGAFDRSSGSWKWDEAAVRRACGGEAWQRLSSLASNLRVGDR